MIFRGKVVAHTDDLKGILVVNLTKETQTQTDSLGRFRIKAEEDDLLIFTAVHLWKVRHLVEKTDFDKENIIPMEVKAEMLDVVEIVRYNFNPEDLGIVPKGQKRYTRSEEHTSELQSRPHLVCRLLLEKKKKNIKKEIQT